MTLYNESFSLEQIISIIIAFVSIILTVFLLSSKSKNYKGNVLLALFLLVNAQDSSGLLASYFIYPKFPGWGMIINSSVFLKMPLLYLYLLSVIYSDFKLRKMHLWHLLPWLLNFIVFIPRYYAVDFDAKWEFLSSIVNRESFEIRYSYITIHLQIAIYLILSYLLIKKYKKLLYENFSNAGLFNYQWLFQLITVFGIEALIASFKNVFMFLKIEDAYDYAYMATSLFGLGFICWLALKALHNPDIFKGISSELQLVSKFKLESNVLKLIPNDIEKIVHLKDYMVKEKPYLDPSLSVTGLARRLQLPVKELSLLINHSLNQHFFDFINGYRIQEAMKILRDPLKKEYTILEILYEVGFNSKSSFNTAFKKHILLTPTQYRKKYCKTDS